MGFATGAVWMPVPLPQTHVTGAEPVFPVDPITGAPAAEAVAPGTGTESNVASSATSVTVLAANTARIGATVFNDSTATLYLLLGSAAASATVYTVQVPPNGYYEVPYRFRGQITGIWASANGNARVTELT